MSEQQTETQQEQTPIITETKTSSASSGMTAVIFGATGATGKHVLSSLLSSSSYSAVHSFVRKPSEIKDEKLKEHLLDYELLLKEPEGEEAKKLNLNADSVFITLGTTKANAGSASQFELIDREYVLAAAKASKSKSSSQKLLYCSAQMASSSSSLLYPKSKGLTEEGLTHLNYSDTIIFRPGFLAGAERPGKTRILEAGFGKIMGLVGKVTDSVEIQTSDLGKSMVLASGLGSSGLNSKGIGSPPDGSFKREGSDNVVTLITNAEAKRLAKKESL